MYFKDLPQGSGQVPPVKSADIYMVVGVLAVKYPTTKTMFNSMFDQFYHTRCQNYSE